MAGSGVFNKAAGDKVFDGDYNAVQTFVNNLMGSGSGNYGYGQLGGSYGTYSSSTSRSSGTKILASDLQNLKADLDKASHHQTGSATALTGITTGTKLSAADWNSYYSSGQTLFDSTNRFRLHATNQALGTAVTGVLTSGWNGTRTHEVSVDFGSANAARYFFNTGGWIQVQGTVDTPGSSGTKPYSWNNMLATRITAMRFGHNYTSITGPGSGGGVTVTTSSAIGWFSGITPGSASWTQILLAVDTTPYSNNDYTVNAKIDATSTYLYLQIIFDDGAVTAPSTIDENVASNVNSIVRPYYALSALGLANGVTVPAPTVTTTSGP